MRRTLGWLVFAVGCSASAGDAAEGNEGEGGAAGQAHEAADSGSGVTGGARNTAGSASSGGEKGTGGAASTGGAGSQGGGGANTGSGGSIADSGVHGPGTCSADAQSTGTPPLLPVGVWTNVAPPDGTDRSGAGTVAVQLDPCNPDTIFISISLRGLWRSDDRGTTWRQLGNKNASRQGRHLPYLDNIVQFEIDPKDPSHLYATSGVGGANMGFWVSQDGGQSWDEPDGFSTLGATVSHNAFDVTALAVDAADFNHFIIGFHSAWDIGTWDGGAGLFESLDAGKTFRVRPPQAGWPSSTLGIAILHEPDLGIGKGNTWLVQAETNHWWRTTDAGDHWTVVANAGVRHGGSSIYYAANGTLYAGGYPAPGRSTDNGVTWKMMTSLPIAQYAAVVGDGSRLYTSPWVGDASQVYTSDDGGDSWAKGQNVARDALFERYDSTHHIVYSASWWAGLLALKVR
jgi:hypothetical protein